MTIPEGTIPASEAVLRDLCKDIAALQAQVGQLNWHADISNERLTHLETQERSDETDRYVELRRIIKVIGLTEILATKTWFALPNDEYDWESVCAELYRRYGHLQFDGKPLWSKSPAPPSLQTKRLIAESLRRRQEA